MTATISSTDNDILNQIVHGTNEVRIALEGVDILRTNIVESFAAVDLRQR